MERKRKAIKKKIMKESKMNDRNQVENKRKREKIENEEMKEKD